MAWWGVWTKFDTSVKDAYIAKPSMTEARFAERERGPISSRIRTNGSATRSSTSTHPTHSTTDAAKSPTTLPAPHPQSGPSLIANSRQTSSPASSAAPR